MRGRTRQSSGPEQKAAQVAHFYVSEGITSILWKLFLRFCFSLSQKYFFKYSQRLYLNLDFIVLQRLSIESGNAIRY